MVEVTYRKVVADGMLIDGRRFELSRVDTDRRMLGIQEATYAIDVSANGELGAFAVGFVNEREARRYLTKLGEMEFTAVDREGREGKVKRDGLGLPTALIRNLERITQNDTADDSPELPDKELGGIDRGRNAPTGAETAPSGDAP